MKYEIELLNRRFDISVHKIWQVINLFCTEFLFEIEPGTLEISDWQIINLQEANEFAGDYNGIPLKINFIKENDRVIWLGIIGKNETAFDRYEQLIGYIEVRQIWISSEVPAEVRIICTWEPFYIFFDNLANHLMTYFKIKSKDQALYDLLEFKSRVERQAYKDFFINGRPQENIGRALLQMFLIPRSYREIPIRGGKSDVMVFDNKGRFLYETKIWRGYGYFEQGIREIEEYIIGEKGENSDSQLNGVFYILFDPTKSAAARQVLGSDLLTEHVAGKTVNIVLISLCPPQPSKKPKSVMRET